MNREPPAPGRRPRPVAIDEMQPGQQLRLIVVSAGAVLAQRVRLALGPWSRLRGLLGAPPLAPGEALLLRPCAGVHTLFMRYPIDVLFVDRAGWIVAVAATLRPWRATGLVAGARAAVELPAGTLEHAGVAVGQLVTFFSADDR